MQLITREIERLLLENGRRAGEDHRPVVRFFHASGPATWLITEMDAHAPDILHGLADLGFGCPELGSVSLRELERVKGLFGLGIERDLHFEARYPLSVYAEAARAAGAIVLAERLLDQAARRLGHPLHRPGGRRGS